MKKSGFTLAEILITLGIIGVVSALVSSKHNSDIKGLILLYPALSLPDVMREWYGSLDRIPDTVRLNDSIDVGKKYFMDIWNLYPFEEIKSDTKEVLILHGTDDSLVSTDVCKRADSIYTNSEFYEIVGAGHGFSGHQFDEAMGHIIDYLKSLNIINK